jgi:saccharopine dehydrogenase-like NADP-dependent oxidoreductase
MSKAILILGAGGIGQAAALFASESQHCAKLIIADRSLDAAEHVAGRFENAQAAKIDVTDAEALATLMTNADAVINCVGPYYRFGPPVLTAAIAARKPYVDVCDDWDPTLDMLTQDVAAQAAGITAIIGIGASPGTANMVAAHVANAISNPKTLITAWSLDDDTGNPEGAANEHWLHQATGTIRVWRNGGYVDEKPLREIPVSLPGLPPRAALTIGHPEAVTLPRTYPDLDTCLNIMTIPGGLEIALKRAARYVEDDGLGLLEASKKAFTGYIPGKGPQHPVYPGVWASADNGADRATAYVADYGRMTDMGTVTAAPAVAGLNLIFDGHSKRMGVLTPEEAFAPETYFTELARLVGVEGEFVTLTLDQVPA